MGFCIPGGWGFQKYHETTARMHHRHRTHDRTPEHDLPLTASKTYRATGLALHLRLYPVTVSCKTRRVADTGSYHAVRLL